MISFNDQLSHTPSMVAGWSTDHQYWSIDHLKSGLFYSGGIFYIWKDGLESDLTLNSMEPWEGNMYASLNLSFYWGNG